VLAVILVATALIGAGIGIGAIVGGSVNEFMARLPQYQRRLGDETAALWLWLDQMGVDLGGSKILASVNPGTAMGLVGNLLTSVGALFANALLIALTVTFILMEASSMPLKLQAALGRSSSFFPAVSQFAGSVNHYVALKTVISILTGVAAALWVWIMGVDFPIIWGVLAFLLNYVPNLGSIVAAIPPVLLCFVQYGSAKAILVAVGYAVINVVVGNIIEPRFMGQGLGLSTLVVFISLVFWGWLFGPVGMLLSVPLTMMLKIGLESTEDSRWLAIVLGPELKGVPVEKRSARKSKAAETAGKPA
jgi:predicted PurR-regulated permease PerM